MNRIAVACDAVTALAVHHSVAEVLDLPHALVVADFVLLVAKSVVLRIHRLLGQRIHFFRLTIANAVNVGAVEDYRAIAVNHALSVLLVILVRDLHDDFAVEKRGDLSLQSRCIHLSRYNEQVHFIPNLHLPKGTHAGHHCRLITRARLGFRHLLVVVQIPTRDLHPQVLHDKCFGI